MRVPIVVLCLMSVGLAGCLQDPPLEEVGAGDPLVFAPLTGLQRELPVRSFEPTIGVASDGTIFMSTLSGSGSLAPAYVARSQDQGVTWVDVTPRVGPITVVPNTNDPFIHLDQDTDRLFTFDLQGTVCQTLSWSDDMGETWITNPAACGLPPGAHDHQMFFTSWPSALPTVTYPKVLHYCVNRLVDSACSASHDGGLTWGPLIQIWATHLVPRVDNGIGIGSCPGSLGHGIGAPDGAIYVPKGCDGVHIFRSLDDGLTWSRHDIARYEWVDHDVGIAADEGGILHAMWIAEGLPYYSRSTDRAETWSKPVMVAPEGVNHSSLPAIAAGAEGRAAITYYGTSEKMAETSRDLGDAVWHAYLTVVIDDDAGTRITTTTMNDPSDPVGRGECGGYRCGSILPTEGPPPPSPGDFLGVAIGPDGRPWAALVDTCRGACATQGEPQWSEAFGAVGTLAEGPSLRGPVGPLPRLVSG